MHGARKCVPSDHTGNTGKSAVKTALVVDDDDTIRSTLKRVLERVGFEVFSAENGRDAQVEIRVRPHDIIFTDLQMPLASGIDVLKTALKERPGTPVILLTAHGSIRDCVE